MQIWRFKCCLPQVIADKHSRNNTLHSSSPHSDSIPVFPFESAGPRLPSAQLDLLRRHHRRRPRRPEPQVHALRLQGQRQGGLSHQGRHNTTIKPWAYARGRSAPVSQYWILLPLSPPNLFSERHRNEADAKSLVRSNWWSLSDLLLRLTTVCTLLK